MLKVKQLKLFPYQLLQYERTGLVEHFPTLIVSGFTVITALLFFNGIVLEAIRQKKRRKFEFRVVMFNVVKERSIKIGQSDKI